MEAQFKIFNISTPILSMHADPDHHTAAAANAVRAAATTDGFRFSAFFKVAVSSTLIGSGNKN
jgi:hypothetical protein